MFKSLFQVRVVKTYKEEEKLCQKDKRFESIIKGRVTWKL